MFRSCSTIILGRITLSKHVEKMTFFMGKHFQQLMVEIWQDNNNDSPPEFLQAQEHSSEEKVTAGGICTDLQFSKKARSTPFRNDSWTFAKRLVYCSISKCHFRNQLITVRNRLFFPSEALAFWSGMENVNCNDVYPDLQKHDSIQNHNIRWIHSHRFQIFSWEMREKGSEN